jgi:ubiquinone biosynthesis monooxygenase Coq7
MFMVDSWIIEFDKGLRTLLGKAQSIRPFPDEGLAKADLNEVEQKLATALMRVNHSGEICAQALYQGQALTARDPVVQQKLQHAAQEETEHLAWTSRRVHELGGHLSALNVFWYTGSLAIGAAVGLMGDKWNLGFLAETERQVGQHLQSHLEKLPQQDDKSRAIVTQMYSDEVGHADMAIALGGSELPQPIQFAMQLNGKLMTTASYWV